MNYNLEEYYEALDRLILNKPINIPKNSKINNDTVALEAGRKRGSIKKSREVFTDLINKINIVNNKNSGIVVELENKIIKYKNQAQKYKELYESSINKELMFLEKINELEKKLKEKNKNNLNNINYGHLD